MDYLQSMLREVSRQAAFDDWIGGGSAAPMHAAERRLIVMLRGELRDRAYLTAVVASLANAAEQAGGRIDAATVRAFLPAHTPGFEAGLQRLQDDAFEPGLVGDLNAYLARLDMVHRLTRAFFRDGGATPPSPAELELLADGCRRACRATSHLDAALTAALGDGEQPGNRTDGGDGVLWLVRLAADGRSPCIAADGEISIPGWAERRRVARYATSEPVTLITDGVEVSATLLDASASGLGIAAARGIARDTAIVVVCADGELLAGRSVWHNAGRIGIALDQPLPVGHRLLGGALEHTT